MMITDAARGDLEEILRLQYIAYESEAALCGTRDIPPLKQTLEEIRGEYDSGVILKMVGDSGSIIGSVRAQEKDGRVYIGKLMVHPAHQRKGYGTKLLKAIEQRFPKRWYELFTSTKSVGNIRLYKSLGYNVFNEKGVGDGLRFVYLQKAVPQGNFDGGVVSFRCGCCQSKVEMKTDTPPEFAGWAYSCERIEWLAQGAPLPRLDEMHFERLGDTPKISEKHRLRICMAFRQALGSEFYMQYLAPELYLSGEASGESYRRCAIVKCRLDRVICATQYSAWVDITVLDVIGYGDMHKRFEPKTADCTLEKMCDYPLEHAENYIDYDDEGWKEFSWTMQGDVGAGGVICTDEKGVRHLIISQYYDFHNEITYFGNIVSRQEPQEK